MLWTCALLARPLPVTVCLTVAGGYSYTSRSADAAATTLTESQSAADILAKEDILDGDNVGSVTCDQIAELDMNDMQARRYRRPSRRAARAFDNDARMKLPIELDHSVAECSSARVDAENTIGAGRHNPFLFTVPETITCSSRSTVADDKKPAAGSP